MIYDPVEKLLVQVSDTNILRIENNFKKSHFFAVTFCLLRVLSNEEKI